MSETKPIKIWIALLFAILIALPYLLRSAAERAPSRIVESYVAAETQSEDQMRVAEGRGTEQSPLIIHDPDVAFWTRLLALVTAALVVYTSGLFYTTRRLAIDAEATAERQAADMRTSLDLTRQIFTSEQRAWIPVNVGLADGLTWGPNGANIHLRFVLQNVGRTPALNVSVTARAFPFNAGSPPPDRLQKEVSEQQRLQRLTGGFTIFPSPDSVVEFGLGINLSNEQVSAARDWWQEGFGHACPGITIAVVGCVSYQLVFGGDQHQTGFMLDLHRTDPVHPNAHFLIEFDQAVPLNELRLGRLFMFGDGITD